MKNSKTGPFIAIGALFFLQKYNEEIKKTAVWADLMSFFLMSTARLPTNSPPFYRHKQAAKHQREQN